MVLDPSSGKPARIGYKQNKDGKKERIFKVSKFKNTKKSTPAKKSAKTTPKGKKS
jgi:lipopolysaccharide/colanic/teichoic acid biosynthesis glycosyltransferase